MKIHSFVTVTEEQYLKSWPVVDALTNLEQLNEVTTESKSKCVIYSYEEHDFGPTRFHTLGRCSEKQVTYKKSCHS